MKVIRIIAIALVLMVTLVICGTDTTDSNGASSSTSASASASPSISTSTTTSAATLDELWEEMLVAVEGTDAGTSERVDTIALFAKDAAKDQNEDIGNEAVAFIWDNWPYYYDSNELMEKVMLCGYYLEYLDYGPSVTSLGQDAEQSVKYVYRGVEKPEDDATIENLDQIRDNIAENF